jgi:hypothetical protein
MGREEEGPQGEKPPEDFHVRGRLVKTRIPLCAEEREEGGRGGGAGVGVGPGKGGGGGLFERHHLLQLHELLGSD